MSFFNSTRRVFMMALVATVLAATSDTSRYPTGYFDSPIKAPLVLTGTFAELRPNHFHSGIDLKGFIGQPMYAAADGYVSRIKIEANGYGKALYVDHPNGYTTLYAHMEQFTEELERYAKSIQYDKQSFEVEILPDKGRFPFAKGEYIGKMGMRGRASGPHLHFEIRETQSQVPINPLLFGYEVKDELKPRMHQVKVYNLNPGLETLSSKTLELVPKNGGYAVTGDTIYIDGWRAGLGIKVYDFQNGSSNWNGIYSIQLYSNDTLIYKMESEKFSFEETRYMNAHIDYEEQVSKNSYFHRLYKLPGNKLSIYSNERQQGVIPVYQNKAVKVVILADDVAGNSTKLTFWIKRKSEGKQPAARVYNYVLPHNEESVVDNGALYLRFPAGAFYENLYLHYHSAQDQSSNIYSTVHHIHNYKTPVHKYFEIGIQPTGLPAELRNKAFIAYCDEKQKISNCGGKWENGKLTTRVRNLGDYYIMVDQIPPTIVPVSFNANMKGKTKMAFKITDNFNSAGTASGLLYNATVDGHWVLMEYDGKKDLIEHVFDGTIDPGEHQLQLKVTDSAGNEKIFEQKFSL